MAKKYIVIGGRGYVGSAIYSKIPGHLIGLRTSSTNASDFIQVRLGSPEDFSSLPISRGDVIFLTAAISAPDICANEHDRAWAVNVIGSINLIIYAIDRGARVVFFSSDTVYGERDDDFDESAICNPAGEYAVMKRELEQRFDGIPFFKAIRLSYVFSKDDKFTRYLGGCAERSEDAELFHPFYRSIVHRDDVVAGALALAERWDEFPEQIINFGGPQVLSRVDFAQALRDVHFDNLRFSVTEPNAEFFNNRPRVIAMNSPVFGRLLGRPTRTLFEAARIEFDAI